MISWHWAKHFLCVLLISFPLITFAANETLQAKVNRTSLPIGQTFQLHLTLSTSTPNQPPKLSVLDQNFELLGRSQSYQMRSVNGQQSMMTSLTLTLLPKRAGVLTIPAIGWGQYRSQPLTVTVKAAVAETSNTANTPSNPSSKTPLDAAQPKNIYMDVSISPKTAYQDGQLIVTIKLHSVYPIHNGKLTAPKAENAWVHPQTFEKNYEEISQGRIYHVFERQYALFPKTSGTLIIHSPRFAGSTLDSFMNSRRFFSSLDEKRVVLTQPPQRIHVKARPAASTIWLPAQNVELIEAWSSDLAQAEIGEPIERQLVLSVKGLTLSQIPDFQWEDIEGLKLYPGKIDSREQFTDGTIHSIVSQTVTYIATHPGQVTIPALQLPWFDVSKGEQKMATLPNYTFKTIQTKATVSNPPNPTTKPQPNIQTLTPKATDLSRPETDSPQLTDTAIQTTEPLNTSTIISIIKNAARCRSTQKYLYGCLHLA